MRRENENSTLENQKFQLIIILQTAENLFLSSIVATYYVAKVSNLNFPAKAMKSI